MCSSDLISIFNLGRLPKKDLKQIKSGFEDAIRTAHLKFKVHLDDNSDKKFMNSTTRIIRSAEILKMAIKKRKENKKENAFIFIFDKPIKSRDEVIHYGEALTYVSEGVALFAFNPLKNYSSNFLRRRAKHEGIHLLGLNVHHEDTKVKGYRNEESCVMEYNAPVINICEKCSDALNSFWKGIKNAKSI